MFSLYFLKVIQSLKFLKQCLRMRSEATVSFYFKLIKSAWQGSISLQALGCLPQEGDICEGLKAVNRSDFPGFMKFTRLCTSFFSKIGKCTLE